jgi:hypothetical protein
MFDQLLIISGPSGCGKSATVRSLANSMGFDIQEWNPFGPTTKWSDHTDKQGTVWIKAEHMIKLFILLIIWTDHESLMTNFIEYLTRSLRHDRTFQNTVNTFSGTGTRRKVILIDDIPDLSNGSSRKRFQNFMRGICGNTDTHVPVILTLTTIEESRGHEPRNGFKKRTYDFAESGVIPADIVESRFCTRIQQVFISHNVIKVLSLPTHQCLSHQVHSSNFKEACQDHRIHIRCRSSSSTYRFWRRRRD